MRHWLSIAAFLSTALFIAPAAAQDVGTATAVNPTSESTPPGSGTITLTVGAHIVHKERIHTSPSGTVQLAFLDTSTLSIAPNSSLLIDEYVYDPKSGDGHMLTNLTEGALRFVGGQLSHRGEAEVTTSSANIGIRGGTVTVSVGKFGTKVINHFGVITVQNGAGTVTISRPGFEVTISNWNTPPGQPARVTAEEIAYFLELLTSKLGQNGGVAGLTNVHIGECGTAGRPGNNCINPPWTNTGAGESDAFQLIIQATQFGTGTVQQHQTPPPPPPPRTH
jgi:hypothetical protein